MSPNQSCCSWLDCWRLAVARGGFGRPLSLHPASSWLDGFETSSTTGSAPTATQRARRWNTYVDLVQRHPQLLRKVLLHHRCRLRNLLIMRLQDIVLLLGEPRLDVARDMLSAIGVVKRRLAHVRD